MKYAMILLISALSFCCKKQDSLLKESIEKKQNEIASTLSKTIVCDINEDNISDTISIRAYEDVRGFAFEIQIKYLWNGNLKLKKIQSGRYTCAYNWGFDAHGKWLKVGYSTDRNYRDYYDIAFEQTENLFYLKRHIGVYPSNIEKYYDIFDDGGITVKSLSFKICKTDYEDFVVGDTILLEKTETTKCIELPYQEETSNINIIEDFLGLNDLESITK